MQAGTTLQWLGMETYVYFSDCTDLEVRFTFLICKLSPFYLLILWPWPSFCLKLRMDFPSFCSFPLCQMGLAQSYTMHDYTRSWVIVVLWTHDSDKYHFTGSGSDFMIGYPTLYVEWCKPQSIQNLTVILLFIQFLSFDASWNDGPLALCSQLTIHYTWRPNQCIIYLLRFHPAWIYLYGSCTMFI